MDETQQSTSIFPFKLIPILNKTIGSAKTMSVVLEKMNKAFAQAPFFTIKEYEIVQKSSEAAVKRLRVPQHFNSPQSDPSHTFSQYVLTMQCPWTLRKVTKRGKVGLKHSKLVKQLNPVLDFNAALSQAYERRITLYQVLAARQEGLYVLYNEKHNGMPAFKDILDKNPDNTRTLINITSPVTLKVVAIQWDYLPSSDVFTPSPPKAQWLSARGMALQAYQEFCQFKNHLGHVHPLYTIFCLAFRRDFNILRPFYEVSLRRNNPSLLHIGVASFSTQPYMERRYGMFDFETLMTKRGLSDKLLRYSPFRDDGKFIRRELKSFAYRLVKITYRIESQLLCKYYRRDRDVKMDRELENFVNELSVDGIGQDGGKRKFTGFPSSFRSRHKLSLFIIRFLWYNIIHATVNYVLSPTFLPMLPVKLHKDTVPYASGKYAHFL
ncbi:uncharacterized protein LOC130636820 [Hydractinia symbiolongicarpus]|uniref:uncharacterized protein LOC130636820 n=1 Tax=Hydractinia symbiolongicarpus TaxID=13093 RepID=UPI00254AE194|nr:uncharacterized protein LOC130636820 [Hydractinia symbiolongicarpus]